VYCLTQTSGRTAAQPDQGQAAADLTRVRNVGFLEEKGKIYNYDLFEPDKNLFAGLTVVNLSLELSM